jgi:hypothetical protein
MPKSKKIRAIRIFDTTLRDGEQSPGATMTVDEKLLVAKQLARLGVDIIEAGFAIASPGDFEAIRRIGGEVEGPVICSLARAKEIDIKRANESLEGLPRKRIHTFHSTSVPDRPGRGTEKVGPDGGTGKELRGRRRVLAHGRNEDRSRISVRGHRGRNRGRRIHGQHSSDIQRPRSSANR